MKNRKYETKTKIYMIEIITQFFHNIFNNKNNNINNKYDNKIKWHLFIR
jgi:hypothetical protein